MACISATGNLVPGVRAEGKRPTPLLDVAVGYAGFVATGGIASRVEVVQSGTSGVDVSASRDGMSASALHTETVIRGMRRCELVVTAKLEKKPVGVSASLVPVKVTAKQDPTSIGASAMPTKVEAKQQATEVDMSMICPVFYGLNVLMDNYERLAWDDGSYIKF